MVLTTFLCDKCAECGIRTPADYLLLADEMDLAGPYLLDLDVQPLAFLKWPMLCHRHHAELPVSARTAYVPARKIVHEIL